MVGTIGAHAKQRPEPRRRQLDARPLLHVAGEQAHHHVVAHGERPDQVLHAGQDLDTPAVAEDIRQLADVRGEARLRPRGDHVGAEARRAHERVEDAEIRPAPEVEARLGGPDGPEDLDERLVEGGAAGPARRHEGAVDVEEDEPHG
jgi:hypothetical protein